MRRPHQLLGLVVNARDELLARVRFIRKFANRPAAVAVIRNRARPELVRAPRRRALTTLTVLASLTLLRVAVVWARRPSA